MGETVGEKAISGPLYNQRGKKFREKYTKKRGEKVKNARSKLRRA